jgi:2-aminoadipate transaminase
MMAATRIDPRTSHATVPPVVRLSTVALRSGDSPISDLMSRALGSPHLVSLAAGFVDHASLPVEATARAAVDLLGDSVEARRALQYGLTRGDPGLRRRLAQRLVRTEALSTDREHEIHERLIVTSGSQQLLYLVAETLLDPGDIVLVEAPTYFVFMGVLQARGARVIGVSTDSGGMRMDALEATLDALEVQGELDRVKLIYTISEHSNPTGLSLAADRRGALVELARHFSKRHRIFVLEDSAYRGLTYEGAEPPSVWSQDVAGETVILARTFSKTFSPGLKTGYAVLPEGLVEPIANLKGSHDFGSSNFAQVLLERVLEDGSYDRQVALLSAMYRRKRDALLRALDQYFGPMADGVSWTHPQGGLYVWLTLPEGVDTGRDGAFFARCVSEGVLYVPGAYAYPAEPGPAPANQARLTFGVTGEAGLAEGVRRLAAALAGLLDPVAG